ncbi:hypothetical protein ACCAA_430021 [Candidatus Accumulibacter aalborgensis]|uniref:Uncharacterized protein n=1 Tax=Candidatus Accumulibacter aalborgensis TaxID=1860102 RepID=A0A1A8XRU5_9PROT|nr:hypothetical protein ACCAA_430021 [Candidatus Accumulibacter aalborgensis]
MLGECKVFRQSSRRTAADLHRRGRALCPLRRRPSSQDLDLRLRQADVPRLVALLRRPGADAAFLLSENFTQGGWSLAEKI